MLSEELLISKISDRILQMVHDSEISENFDCLKKRSEVSFKYQNHFILSEKCQRRYTLHFRYKLDSKSVEMANFRIVVHNLPYRGRKGRISHNWKIALYKYTPQSIDLRAGKNVIIFMKTANIDISKS